MGDLDDFLAEQMEDPEFALHYELAEARSEIARHHELIAWMREELRWALPYAAMDKEAREHAFDVAARLNQEVG